MLTIAFKNQHKIKLKMNWKREIKFTLESLSLGDTDDIDHLVLGKDLLDGDLLLEVLTGEVNLKEYDT
jgi:hypothetical protein